MRLTRWMCGLVVAASASCSSSLTAPPTGLPVTVALVSVGEDAVLPSIMAAADSVVVVVRDPNNACATPPTSVAGLRSGMLVVTLSSVEPSRVCGVLAGFNSFSVTVRNVPSGTRTVRLRMRTTKGGTTEESTLAEGTIAGS